ncbi:MAG: ATPase, partial [Deltaproteobacteria bacterium]|nr:ATPase [Deltaproteobacteria bacterium]
MTEESRKIHVSVIPKAPKTVEETGLSLQFLVELACKTLYFGGVLSLSSISEQLALPVSVGNDIMEFLKKERLAEVKKGGDIRAAYTFALTDLGRERAKEYLQLSSYVGPAPVTLEQYTEVARKQTVRKMAVSRDTMEQAFEGVVLPPGMLERLGPAVNSGRSIFLYGPSGNGKTFIAERLAKVLSGSVFVPYAVGVGHQTIRVFDPVTHVPIDLGGPLDPARAAIQGKAEYDRRFVL